MSCLLKLFQTNSNRYETAASASCACKTWRTWAPVAVHRFLQRDLQVPRTLAEVPFKSLRHESLTDFNQVPSTYEGKRLAGVNFEISKFLKICEMQKRKRAAPAYIDFFEEHAMEIADRTGAAGAEAKAQWSHSKSNHYGAGKESIFSPQLVHLLYNPDVTPSVTSSNFRNRSWFMLLGRLMSNDLCCFCGFLRSSHMTGNPVGRWADQGFKNCAYAQFLFHLCMCCVEQVMKTIRISCPTRTTKKSSTFTAFRCSSPR